MSTLSSAREILDTMLGHLGFVSRVEAEEGAGGPSLQVLTEDAEVLAGTDGERLDDLQYLLNRLVRSATGSSTRIRVDVEHFREMREDALVEEARRLAKQVIQSGQAAKMRPLNSYFRRVVHNAFADDPDIETLSPPDEAKLKRITLAPRR